jgi:hypothetical protein
MEQKKIEMITTLSRDLKGLENNPSAAANKVWYAQCTAYAFYGLTRCILCAGSE